MQKRKMMQTESLQRSAEWQVFIKSKGGYMSIFEGIIIFAFLVWVFGK